ncbi:MAG: hypothetical protein AB7F66_06035 [Bacteriovoracia bacterium]
MSSILKPFFALSLTLAALACATPIDRRPSDDPPARPPRFRPEDTIARLQKAGTLRVAATAEKLATSIELPAGTRVVRLNPEGEVLLRWNGQILHGRIPPDILGGWSWPAHVPPDWEIFRQEAELHLYVLTLETRAFAKMTEKIRSRLAKQNARPREAAQAAWLQALERVRARIASSDLDKPGSLEKAQTEIGSALGLDLASAILAVPISEFWLLTQPSLGEALKRGEFDPLRSHLRGNSGEGVSTPADRAVIFQQLLRIQRLTEGTADEGATPESIWLQSSNAADRSKIKSIVFIHDGSWERHSAPLAPRMWADFIPIDAALGALSADPIFSILLHEMNVNSSDPQVLPQDSHGSADYGQAVWESSREDLDKALAKPEDRRTLFQIRPELSLVYVAMILQEMENTERR